MKRESCALLRVIAIFRAAGARFSRDACAILAQAIAFNALFAIFPLTILAIATLAFVYGNVDGEQRAFALILQLAPELQDLLTENLRNVVTFRGVSGAVSLVGLIWTGKNLFQALAFALDRALGVPQPRPLLPNIIIALVMLPLLGVLLLAATAVPIAVSVFLRFGSFPHWSALPQIETYAFSLLVVFAASSLLYRYLPYRAMEWRFVLPGAAFSALTFNLAQIGFAIYTTRSP
jgi:membrane protein